MKAGVVLVAIQGEQSCRGKQGIQTKVMTTLFTLFAEVERDTISNRTGEGLAKAATAGVKWHEIGQAENAAIAGGQGLFLGRWTAKKTRYQRDAEEDA